MTSPSTPRATPDAPRSDDFDADLSAAMRSVRAALTELLTAIGAPASRPQEMSRRFGLNRNLAWKLSKIVHADDPTSVIGHLPGPSGLKILLDTCGEHGAGGEVLQRVVDAQAALDAVAERHAGGRAGLDVLLNARTDGAGAREAQEAARRQAFLANAAIWGVQARVQLGLHVHTPHAGAVSTVDAASVSGVLGFQRLRPTASWPLVRLQAYDEDAGQIDVRAVRPIDPDTPRDTPPVVRPFSSVRAEQLHPVDVTAGTLWELKRGAVGLTGTTDCLFGRRVEAIGPSVAGPKGGSAVARLPLNTPIEVAQIDLLVHRDLAYADRAPRAEILSRLETEHDARLDARRPYTLPVPGEVLDLGASPPTLASPYSPRQREIAAWMLGHLGHELDAFRAWRLLIPYPPIPSAPSLVIELPEG